MIIKVVDNKATPLIGNEMGYKDRKVKIDEENVNEVKKKVEEGRKILIEKDGNMVEGEEYFKGKSKKKTTVDADVDKVGYKDLFEGHWKVQVKNIKENFDEPEEIEKVIEYAENNDVADTIIKRIKDYKKELEE